MATDADLNRQTGTAGSNGVVQTKIAVFELERRRHFLWNMVLLRVYMGLWGIGDGLVGIATIVPVFMARAGLSKVLIGLLPALNFLGGSLPQPVSAYSSAGLAKKKGQMLWFHVPCLAMSFLLALGSLFASEGRSAYSAVLVLGTCGVFAFSMGLVNPLWFELVAKVVPEGRRGGFFGLNWTVISAFGVAGAFLAKEVLSRRIFPLNFGFSFLAGATLYSLSAASLLPVREPASPEVSRRPPLRGFLLRLFREAHFGPNYRNFLIERLLVGIASMPLGFLSVYATRKFQLPSSAAASYTMAMMAAVVLTGVFWGCLGEKIGYRLLSLVGVALWIAGIAWALLAPSPYWFALAFFIVGMARMVDFVGSINIVLESCPTMEKAGFVAISNLLVTPGFAVGPVFGGVIAQYFSYEVMFGLAIAVFVVCWLILAFLFIDPRRAAAPQRSPR